MSRYSVSKTAWESDMIDLRLNKLTDWLKKQCACREVNLAALPGDASFRRYFRLQSERGNYMVMDAPPEKESSKSFVAIAQAWYKLGLNVPYIYEADLEQGFLLLTDFGDQLYLGALNARTASSLYQRAVDDLLTIQSCQSIAGWDLPTFDSAEYLQELENFRVWFLQKHCGLDLTAAENAMLDELFAWLVQKALEQPQVCVHRDYHSRNLMVLPDAKVGILDFQDALWGPITYDLVSLLRDCYIDWPEDQVKIWALSYLQQLNASGLIAPQDPALFLQWFDWMGVQRHLKAIFIFARKFHRDQDDSYLQYIPRGLNYVKSLAGRYPELRGLQAFFLEKGI